MVVPGGSSACRGCVEPASLRASLSEDAEKETRLGALMVECVNRDRGCFWARARDKLELHLEKTCKHSARPKKTANTTTTTTNTNPNPNANANAAAGAGTSSDDPPPPSLSGVSSTGPSPSGSARSRSPSLLVLPSATGSNSNINNVNNSSNNTKAVQEEMIRLVEEVEVLLQRKRGVESALKDRAERAEREVQVLREEVEMLRLQLREALDKEDARKKEEQKRMQELEEAAEKKRKEEEKKRREEERRSEKQKIELEEERRRKEEEDRRKKKEQEEEERRKKKEEEEDERRKKKEQEEEERRKKKEEEEEERRKKKEQEEEERRKKKEEEEEERRKKNDDLKKEAEEKRRKEEVDAAAAAAKKKEVESDSAKKKEVESDAGKKKEDPKDQEDAVASKEPPLPSRRTKKLSANSSANASVAAAASASAVAFPIEETCSPACVRAMLLVATEKLRGDSEFKADMPLTSVAESRLVLLFRTGALLGKTVARLYPGRFDPLCLRSKGGESAWKENLDKVWTAVGTVLPTGLQASVLDGMVAAGLYALLLILRDAHSSRARAAARQYLLTSSDTWPLRAVLRVWALCCALPDHASAAAPPEWESPAAVPRPTSHQIAEALIASGAATERRSLSVAAAPAASTAAPSLFDVLKGGPMEGLLIENNDEQLPDDAEEILLLWAAAKSTQKSKLRSSVIKAAGSDTSWIDRSSKKK